MHTDPVILDLQTVMLTCIFEMKNLNVVGFKDPPKPNQFILRSNVPKLEKFFLKNHFQQPRSTANPRNLAPAQAAADVEPS